MSYTLVITEKPSAANRIAHALSDGEVDKRSNGKVPYYRITRKGRDLVVAPAVGHLFVLDETEKNHKWTYPVFSVEWKPTYTQRGNEWAKKYYDNMKKLAEGADSFISACDYDIEGSVIAWNILSIICNVSDGNRMKFSTLTTPDLVKAYEEISPHLDFSMIEAGLTRHQLDWYFGVNLSRALTISLERAGGYWTLSTGRVQGPTLELLLKREKEIAKFRPVPYWEIDLTGDVHGEEITASHVEGKFWEKEKAESVIGNCSGKDGTVAAMSKKEQKHPPPFPFDLTTLQRESYGLFGYSPKMTLDLAQSLYEQALISYPRTSSQQIPPTIGYKKILQKLSGQKHYEALCDSLLSKSALRPNQGKKKDPAHPAIFPTGSKPKKMNSYEAKIYDLIVRRFLSTFADWAVREMLKVEIKVGSEDFATTGAKTLSPGWMEYYKPYVKIKEVTLPDMKVGDTVTVRDISMNEKETQPPSRYSQASILKEMEDLGLGTKATRANILHTLYERGYIREKSIVVTDLGKAVIEALEGHCPEIISVELTRRFEEDMEKIASGSTTRQKIIAEAQEKLGKILDKFKENEKGIGDEMKEAVKEYEREQHDVGKCGKCGKGEIMVIHSRKTGKRFAGCDNYPDCRNSFPLPQRGQLTLLSRKCHCGLKLAQVKSKGKRPWKFCVAHGFDYTKKKDGKDPGKGKKAAKPAEAKKE